MCGLLGMSSSGSESKVALSSENELENVPSLLGKSLRRIVVVGSSLDVWWNSPVTPSGLRFSFLGGGSGSVEEEVTL